MKVYKIFISIESIVMNDSYIAEYDGIEYQDRRSAEKAMVEGKDKFDLFIREVEV